MESFEDYFLIPDDVKLTKYFIRRLGEEYEGCLSCVISLIQNDLSLYDDYDIIDYARRYGVTVIKGFKIETEEANFIILKPKEEAIKTLKKIEEDEGIRFNHIISNLYDIEIFISSIELLTRTDKKVHQVTERDIFDQIVEEGYAEGVREAEARVSIDVFPPRTIFCKEIVLKMKNENIFLLDPENKEDLLDDRRIKGVIYNDEPLTTRVRNKCIKFNLDLKFGSEQKVSELL